MEIDWNDANVKNASTLVQAAVTFARGAFNFGSFDPGMKELKMALKFLEKLPPSPLRARLVKKVKDMAIYGKRMMDLSAQNRPDRKRSADLGDLGMATKKRKKKTIETVSALRPRVISVGDTVEVIASGTDDYGSQGIVVSVEDGIYQVRLYPQYPALLTSFYLEDLDKQNV